MWNFGVGLRQIFECRFQKFRPCPTVFCNSTHSLIMLHHTSSTSHQCMAPDAEVDTGYLFFFCFCLDPIKNCVVYRRRETVQIRLKFHNIELKLLSLQFESGHVALMSHLDEFFQISLLLIFRINLIKPNKFRIF